MPIAYSLFQIKNKLSSTAENSPRRGSELRIDKNSLSSDDSSSWKENSMDMLTGFARPVSTVYFHQ